MEQYIIKMPDKSRVYGFINRTDSFYRKIGKRGEINLKIKGNNIITKGINHKILEKLVQRINDPRHRQIKFSKYFTA